MKNIDESAIVNLSLILNLLKNQTKYKEINNYIKNFPRD